MAKYLGLPFGGPRDSCVFVVPMTHQFRIGIIINIVYLQFFMTWKITITGILEYSVELRQMRYIHFVHV